MNTDGRPKTGAVHDAQVSGSGVGDARAGGSGVGGTGAGTAGNAATMPDELSPRHIRRRLVQIALVVVVVAVVVLVGPGLGSLRHSLAHASPAWLVAGLGLEVLSALCYVVIFKAVFCPRMSWRTSYQIGMSEQGANSVLSVSGAGGLALGAWALHRGGMSTEYIARRTVAFFLLTSLANVGAVVVFAFLYAVGVFHHNPNPVLTDGFGIAALAGIAIVAALPPLLAKTSISPRSDPDASRVRAALHFVRYSLGQGVRDAWQLLGQRPIPILGGSVGTLAFDLAVLGVSFKAVGHTPPFGVLVMGYLIGQLGGNVPVPGGIGGLDAGLIGTFALFHQPLAPATAAVLIYHTISLWIPALLGSVAFVQLRNTLRHAVQPAAICMPLIEPIEPVSRDAVAA